MLMDPKDQEIHVWWSHLDHVGISFNYGDSMNQCFPPKMHTLEIFLHGTHANHGMCKEPYPDQDIMVYDDKKRPLNEMMIISGGLYPWGDGRDEGTQIVPTPHSKNDSMPKKPKQR
jgi:hypothetical protein